MIAFEVIEADGPKRFFERLSLETLGHGYLFSGAPGVGKRTFARALAKSILCAARGARGGVLGYDDACPSCRLFAAGTHPDYFEHEGELRIGERDGAPEGLSARELVRALSLRGYGAAQRVVVLGEMSFATHHAANALLKFFEEPPPGVHLIVTSSAVGKLLGTIRSRLVEIPFGPLSQGAVAAYLQGRGTDAAVAERIAASAQGSLSRAASLLDGAGLREEAASWFFAATGGETEDATWAARATLEEGIELIALLVRDWLVYNVDDTRRLLSGERSRIASLPRDVNAGLQALGAVDEARRIARSNVSPALVADGLRLALAEAAAGAR